VNSLPRSSSAGTLRNSRQVEFVEFVVVVVGTRNVEGSRGQEAVHS
jgi:hypothetical protein